jgi:arylsulfatase A-like enzyme
MISWIIDFLSEQSHSVPLVATGPKRILSLLAAAEILILAVPWTTDREFLNHKGGQRTGALVELLDLYPTLADLCGLQAPDELEGVSLVPVLNDPRRTVKTVALTQTPRPNYPRGKLPEIMGYSIRANRFRYTEWRDFQSGQVRARELYDHQHDPAETVNVVGADRYSQDVERLAAQMRPTVRANKLKAMRKAAP